MGIGEGYELQKGYMHIKGAWSFKKKKYLIFCYI